MSFEKIAKYIPKSLQRQVVGQLSNQLKSLLRKAHEGEELRDGEADFALVLFQADKNTPDSMLYAVVSTIDECGEILRPVKSYKVDQLITQMQTGI